MIRICGGKKHTYIRVAFYQAEFICVVVVATRRQFGGSVVVGSEVNPQPKMVREKRGFFLEFDCAGYVTLGGGGGGGDNEIVCNRRSEIRDCELQITFKLHNHLTDDGIAVQT